MLINNKNIEIILNNKNIKISLVLNKKNSNIYLFFNKNMIFKVKFTLKFMGLDYWLFIKNKFYGDS